MIKGQKHSEETKEKLRKLNTGKVHSTEHRLAISKGMKGGNSTSFKKGMIPFNKGKKYPLATGENNKNWKGNDVGYGGLHSWVSLNLGKNKNCESCGISDQHKKYEWANISKSYKRDLNDWKRLCVPCHREFDGHTKKIAQKTIDGKLVMIWKSSIEAQRVGGFQNSAIGRCCKKIKNYNTHKGYIWEYYNG